MSRSGSIQGFSGERLRELRERAGLSQAELAGKAGVQRVELAAYEQDRVPTPERLVPIAGALGISPFDLLDRELLGYGLRSLRVAAGLGNTIMQLRLGVTPTVMGALERGTMPELSRDLAVKLAALLGVSLAQVREAHAWDVSHPGSRFAKPEFPVRAGIPAAAARKNPVSGARLRELRERAGLSADDMHREIGVTEAELAGYESGAKVPQARRLRLLAGLFGVTTADLLDREVVGYGLRAMRIAAGLSTERLMIKADISAAVVRQLDAATAELTWELEHALAEALGARPAEVRAAYSWDVAHPPVPAAAAR